MEQLMESGHAVMSRMIAERDRLVKSGGMQAVHGREQQWLREKTAWVSSTTLALHAVFVSPAHPSRFARTPYPDAWTAQTNFSHESILAHMDAFIERLESFRREILDSEKTYTVEAVMGDKNTVTITGSTIGPMAVGTNASASNTIRVTDQLRTEAGDALDALRKEFEQVSSETSDTFWRVLTRIAKLEADQPSREVLERLVASVGELEVQRFAAEVKKLPAHLELARAVGKQVLGEALSTAAEIAAAKLQQDSK
ncbi:MAG: hypothetical protein ACXVEF_42070 [Polyangiales bacterium]